MRKVPTTKRGMAGVRKRSVLAVILILLGLLMLSSAVYSHIAAGDEPRYPDEAPRDVPLLELANKATDVPKISTDSSSFLIPCDEGVRINVLFEEKASVNGLWSGSNPMMQITAPYSNTFSADAHQETWGTQLPDNVKRIEPSITVTFLVGKDYVHKWIQATASVEVVYPVRIEGFNIYCPGGRCFRDEQELLSRDLRFFVLSPEEFVVVGQYIKWHDSRGGEQRLFAASALFLSVGLLVVLGERAVVRKGIFSVERREAQIARSAPPQHDGTRWFTSYWREVLCSMRAADS
jgi:hypothetical protein